ncbi:MAG: hypothetical protein HQK83_05920 [Fibrobacteria bacterium]|nr:hypothetical protein [Fibrobacteria bacterium]
MHLTKIRYSLFFVLLHITTTFAINFDAPKAITGTDGGTQCRVAAGPNGDFHLVYMKSLRSSSSIAVDEGAIYYARYRDNEWSTPIILENSMAFRFADIAGDSAGNAYITWITNDRLTYYFVTVTNAKDHISEYRSIRNAIHAVVHFDTKGNIRSIYRDKSPETNPLLTRRPGDNSWQSEDPIPQEGTEGQRQFSIASDSKGNLHYGYRWMDGGSVNRALSYRIYDAATKTWSDKQGTFSGNTKPWGPTVAVDKDDKVHMVFGGGEAEEVSLYYRNPNGSVLEIDGKAGEYGWPPTMAITDSGEIIIAHSHIPEDQAPEKPTAHYLIPSPIGTAHYLEKGPYGFGSSKTVDSSATAISWPTITAHSNTVMIVYGKEDKIFYRMRIPAGKDTVNCDTCTTPINTKTAKTPVLNPASEKNYDLLGREVKPEAISDWRMLILKKE